MNRTDTISRYCSKILLLLVMVLVFTTPLVIDPTKISGKLVVDAKKLIVALTCLGIVIVVCVKSLAVGYVPFRLTLPGLALAGFWISILLSALLSKQPGFSLREGFLTLGLIAVFFCLQENSVNTHAVDTIRKVAIAAGLIVAVHGICQYVGFDFFYQLLRVKIIPEEARHRLITTIGNPAYLGSYIAALALLVFADLVGKTIRPSWWVQPGVMAVLMVVLVLTETRGAWIGFFVGSVIILGAYIRKGIVVLTPWKRRFLVIAIGLIVSVSVIFSFPNALNRRYISLFERVKELADIRSNSVRERLFFYILSTEMIYDHPMLGVGEGMFKLTFSRYSAKIAEQDVTAGADMMLRDFGSKIALDAHNDFLQIWVENGTIGYLCYMFFIVTFFYFVFKTIFAVRNPKPFDHVGIGLSAAVTCLIVDSLFSFPMHMPTRAVLLWVGFGLTHRICVIEGGIPHLTFSPLRRSYK